MLEYNQTLGLNDGYPLLIGACKILTAING